MTNALHFVLKEKDLICFGMWLVIFCSLLNGLDARRNGV